MKKIETVIFDWAGTTVDYGCFAPVQAFMECFKSVGIEPTIDEVRAPMGMLKRQHIQTMLAMPRLSALFQQQQGRAWNEQDVDAMHDRFETSLFAVLGDFCAPKPHLLQTVAWLREQGIAIGSTTGYTDKMMEIVAPRAKELGYSPDFCITPNGVGGHGRPYPYMIFRNLEQLGTPGVKAAVKVGDTVSDIQEGVNAGVWSIGVIEGSSELALSQAEYEALSPAQQQAACRKVAETYLAHGAHGVIGNLSELPALIAKLEETL